MAENSSTVTPAAERAVVSQDQDILTAAKGGGIIFFGSLFDYANRFIFGIIIARALGADGFGLYTVGVTVAITLGSFAMLGLEAAMVHFLPAAIFKRDEARIWGTLQVGLAFSTIIGLGFGLIVFASAGVLAQRIFQDPAVIHILRWISITIPLVAIGRVLGGATRGFKHMQYQVYANDIVSNIVKIALTVLFLGLGMGLSGALAAYAIAWLITDCLLVIFLNRLFSFKRPFQAAYRQTRDLLTFSLPICLDQVIRQAGVNFELLLLGMLTTAAGIGIFSAAVRVQMVGAMFLMAAELVARPIISDLYHRNEILQLGQFYQTLTRWSLSFVLPYSLTVVLFANPILGIFGDDFRGGAVVLIIISLGTLVDAGTGICGAMIVMTGHSRLTFFNSLIVVILHVILNLILIPLWELMGAAVATSLAVATVNLMRLLQVYKLHKLWPYNGEFVKPFIASVAALVAVIVGGRFVPAGESIFYLFFNIILLWSTFTGITFLLGITSEDQLVLSHVKRRIVGVIARA